MALPETLTEIKKPIGLGAQIAETLKIAILEGEFRGGQQLGEQDLQNRFGVSRSPLREAFRELEKVGLVEIIPRRGSFVKRISRHDIEENFPIRAALEGLAAKLAAEKISDETLALMEEALEEMGRAVAANNINAYYSHHLRFHELFIESAHNDLLKATLTNLRMQSLWHRFSYHYYQEDLPKSYRAHQEIMKCFQSRDKDTERLRELVERHINVALDSFLHFLETFEHQEGG
jgi:DNA-binding GntR family transcriptional regulator